MRIIEPAHGRAPELAQEYFRSYELGEDEHLTEREREILVLYRDGANGPEAAKRLIMSRHTLNSHMRLIRLKLGVHTTTAAVVAAIRRGDIELNP